MCACPLVRTYEGQAWTGTCGVGTRSRVDSSGSKVRRVTRSMIEYDIPSRNQLCAVCSKAPNHSQEQVRWRWRDEREKVLNKPTKYHVSVSTAIFLRSDNQ